MSHLKSFKYKNILGIFVGVLFAFIVFQLDPLHKFLLSLGEFGILGAFFAGILYVSTFTVVTGAVILLVLAERFSPIEVALIGGLGAVVGDFLIFKLIRNTLTSEITQIYDKFGGGHLTKLFHSRYFSWTMPVIGALIIASPLPDDIGVSLLGFSKMKTWEFVILSFILDFIGILLVVSASAFIKP